jgi:hypothetical protein
MFVPPLWTRSCFEKCFKHALIVSIEGITCLPRVNRRYVDPNDDANRDVNKTHLGD